MNLNDPFGRMAKQRQKEYESLCSSLRSAGINTRREAEQLRQSLGRRATIGVAVLAPIVLLLAMLLPEMRVFIFGLGALVAVWLINTNRHAQRHIERYIREELSGQPPKDDESSPPPSD